MREMLRAVTPIDLAIFVFLGYMLWGLDYANLTIINVVYMTAALMWFVMLVIRLAVVYRRRQRK